MNGLGVRNKKLERVGNGNFLIFIQKGKQIMKRINLKCKNLSPNQRRIRLQELSGIPISEKNKKRILNETVTQILPMRLGDRNKIQSSMIKSMEFDELEDEDEVDLEEILKEMGYSDEEGLKPSDFELTDEELQSIQDELEDDSVNEFNSPSKGYKEGRKLVDTLRKGLFRKFSDDDLDEFMDVISNSFNLVRK